MKTNTTDFARTALCADGALGLYAPYGLESVVPIRGGIDVIWHAFPQAVPNFRVKVIETIVAEGNSVVIQAEMSGPIPADVPGIAKVTIYLTDKAFYCRVVTWTKQLSPFSRL